MRGAPWMLLGVAAVLGCTQPGPVVTVGQPPSSAHIRLLRQRTLDHISEMYRGQPRHVVVDFETADRYLGSGDIPMARSAYRRLIAWFPTGRHRRAADFWLAYCDEMQGRRSRAAEGYHAVAAKMPEEGDLWGREAQRRLEQLTAP